MFCPEDESRCRLCSVTRPWRFSWCWHQCSQEYLKQVRVGVRAAFSLVEHEVFYYKPWYYRYPELSKERQWNIENISVRSNRISRVGMWTLGKFSNTCKSVILRHSTKERKAQVCFQLKCRAGLTFLQLSHHVIVLEESLTDKRVCEQHLEKWTKNTVWTCKWTAHTDSVKLTTAWHRFNSNVIISSIHIRNKYVK